MNSETYLIEIDFQAIHTRLSNISRENIQPNIFQVHIQCGWWWGEVVNLNTTHMRVTQSVIDWRSHPNIRGR